MAEFLFGCLEVVELNGLAHRHGLKSVIGTIIKRSNLYFSFLFFRPAPKKAEMLCFFYTFLFSFFFSEFVLCIDQFSTDIFSLMKDFLIDFT